jgi:hypothetical protein
MIPTDSSRRKATKAIGALAAMSFLPTAFAVAGPGRLDLAKVRKAVNEHFESLHARDVSFGAYRVGVDSDQLDMYATCDIAIARHIMGENLTGSLRKIDRMAWVEYINSYQQPGDGSYSERYNHSELHANGMSIGALGVLGGRQQYPVKLYEPFDTPEEVGPWLEQVNWEKQWGASHLFWGGIHCYSLSTHCEKPWLRTVFQWLNHNLDPTTGWWRKGTVYTDRHQPLGGSVHILPIYQHHQQIFPLPEKVIDSVLALQLPSGRWLNREKDKNQVMHYLELDALYALNYMQQLAPGYRKNDIAAAVKKYASRVMEYWHAPDTDWRSLHPHRTLSMVGTFGLLQKLLPEHFHDTVTWTDIFSDIALYNTARVEARTP